MPEWSQVVFHSPVIVGAVTAIAMNAALNGLSMRGQVAMAH